MLAFCTLGLTLASCDENNNNNDDDSLERNKITKEAGESFMKENRTKPGVVETFSGLQYKVDSLGTGLKPLPADSVTLEFVGKLISGETFVSNTEKLLLGAQIEGLKQGLRYMPEGSKFTLYIPYYLAYREAGRTFYYEGNSIEVEAYSAVVFDCKLKTVKRNE